MEHGAIQGHPLADQPQDLLSLVADVEAALLLTASRGLRVEGARQSRKPQHPTEHPPHLRQREEGADRPGMRLVLWRVQHRHAMSHPFSPLHTPSLGLEGYWCRRAAQSWVLGMKTLWVRRKSLRNVSVGQAGVGDRWEVGLHRSSPLDTVGVPSPKAAMEKVPPVPSPRDSTPYPSQEHRNEGLLPTGPTGQASTQSSQVPSPLPGGAAHLMSQTQAGVSCPYLLGHEHWNQAAWPPTAVLGSSPGCPTSPYTWQKRPIHVLVPPPPPQPGQMAVISHITLPYLSALPHLGVEGWLFRGISESQDASLPSRQGYDTEERRREGRAGAWWVCYRFLPGVGGQEELAP